MKHEFWRSAKKYYSSLALHVLNTLILLVLLNIGIGLLFWFRSFFQREPNHFVHQYDGISNAPYAAEVLDTFRCYTKNAFVYQPWAQHGPSLIQSKHVNVVTDATGIPVRRTDNQQDDTPAIRIFAFGGSTTFGYLVPDGQTWPSHLSQILNQRAQAEGLNCHIEVTNYGRISSFPSEEIALYMDLLKLGHRPHLAIFMDGVNKGPAQDIGVLSSTIEAGFRDLQNPQMIGTLAAKLPMVRLAKAIRNVWDHQPDQEKHSQAATTNLINRFTVCRGIAKKLSDLFNVQVRFVLQPRTVIERKNKARQAIDSDLQNALDEDPNYLNLTHLADEYDEERKWTLNGIHYTPDFSRFLAETLAAQIDLTVYEPTINGVHEKASTGAARTRATSLRPRPQN